MNGASQRFPTACRIRERREFKLVERQGGRASGSHFVVFVHRADDGRRRLGVTVSRRVGGAVIRNRVKRLVREVFRRGSTPAGDVVVIARTGAGGLAYGEVQAELARLWQRAAAPRS